MDGRRHDRLGGGSPDIEVKKSQITINGVHYARLRSVATTPYWTLVDTSLSHNVEVFNFVPRTPDFDGNDIVDGTDFLIWQRDVGSGTLQTQGDANGDGAVNGADLQIWRDAFRPAGVASAAGAVPEPSAFALAGLRRRS